MTRIFFLVVALYMQSDTMIKGQELPSNKLIHATSPYLRQHAYNPVDWYEWGPEALEKAKAQNLPILVSIGYSACHWCHVMAHESFEDEEVATLMNQYFINIKIDREERPDIDRIYMDAVQAMGINGGWPLNVFLTQDQKPFYGGTYFNRKNWAQILVQISNAYQNNRSKIDESANQLTMHLRKSILSSTTKGKGVYTKTGIKKMYNVFASQFDTIHGGLNKKPKFPMPAQWLFLLRYHFFDRQNTDKALAMTELTLERMATGGIYDQVGGGFSRYSVDEKWFAPHFEKMLYDNAQLLSLYSEAYAITQKTLYKRIVYEVVSWLKEEMRHPEGGFYSSLDADSEGEEGKYYVWEKQEFDSVLSLYPNWISDYYNVREKGNWEHGNNILFIDKKEENFLKKNHINPKEFALIIKNTKALLHKKRKQRIRPGTDKKILTGWNAMMLCGLIDAYRAFGEDEFLMMAKQCMRFIEKNLLQQKLYRSFLDKRSNTEGFLEDYAWVINAYIALYQSTFEERYLNQANYWTKFVKSNFSDKEEGFFYFSSDSSNSLIARKKELFDNVIPCSNSVMARNLYRLGILLDRSEYVEQAREMITRMQSIIESEPLYMSNWAMAYMEMVNGLNEVAVVGIDCKTVAKELQKNYTPFSLFLGTDRESSLSLLRGKTDTDLTKTTIYVCRNNVCKLPVRTTKLAMEQILSDLH